MEPREAVIAEAAPGTSTIDPRDDTLSPVWPLRKKHPRITSIPDDRWVVATGELNGRAIVVRLNAWAWDIRGHQDYAWRIGIAAPVPDHYDTAAVNDDNSPYRKLEYRAAEVLEANLESIMVATITALDAPRFRELVFHTRDRAAAQPRVEALCREFDGIEAAAVIEHDPRWKSFTFLCGGRKP